MDCVMGRMSGVGTTALTCRCVVQEVAYLTWMLYPCSALSESGAAYLDNINSSATYAETRRSPAPSTCAPSGRRRPARPLRPSPPPLPTAPPLLARRCGPRVEAHVELWERLGDGQTGAGHPGQRVLSRRSRGQHRLQLLRIQDLEAVLVGDVLEHDWLTAVQDVLDAALLHERAGLLQETRIRDAVLLLGNAVFCAESATTRGEEINDTVFGAGFC